MPLNLNKFQQPTVVFEGENPIHFSWGRDCQYHCNTWTHCKMESALMQNCNMPKLTKYIRSIKLTLRLNLFRHNVRSIQDDGLGDHFSSMHLPPAGRGWIYPQLKGEDQTCQKQKAKTQYQGRFLVNLMVHHIFLPLPIKAQNKQIISFPIILFWCFHAQWYHLYLAILWQILFHQISVIAHTEEFYLQSFAHIAW